MHILRTESDDALIVEEDLSDRAIGGRVRFEGSVALEVRAIERVDTALFTAED